MTLRADGVAADFPEADGIIVWRSAFCTYCNLPSIWLRSKMVYPLVGLAPPPNPDLPDDIQDDYKEAAEILHRSPRGAAAILRLAVQKLCQHLGLPGDNLNNDIGELVRRGLLPEVQQAFDAVRVIGNNAVHPGRIDLTDDHSTASTLFLLVNMVSERMITNPKQARAIYDSLPEAQKQAIARRDA